MKKIHANQNNKSDDFVSKLTLFIAIIGIAIVPLLIRVVPVKNALVDYTWYGGDSILYDSYAFFKSQIVVMLGILSTSLITYKQFKYKTYSVKDPIIIAALIFTVFTIISHIFSISPELSSQGMNDRFESTWVWLSYISIFILIYGENWTDLKLNKIAKYFILSNIVLSTIGLFQYFGFDLVFNNFTKPFITSFKMGGVDFSADYSINYKVIVQTLYHYNYVGYYLSLSIPIIMTYAIHEVKLKYKVGYLLLLGLMLFNLLGSSARGGLVGVVSIVPIFIILNQKRLFKNIKIFIALIIIGSVVFIGFESYTDGFITKRITNIFTSVSAPNKLQSIKLEKDTIDIQLDTGRLIVNIYSSDNSTWPVDYTFNGEKIIPEAHPSEGFFQFNITGLKQVKVYPTVYGEMTLLTIETYGQPWYFAYNENEQLKYINPYGKFDDIVVPDTLGFEGQERLGSARGYIWSRSLPLILKSPMLGYGADTFSIVFPQQDYVGKYNAYNTTNMLVDKPHNLYFQIALNSGVIALITYIFLISLLITKSIRSFFSHRAKYDFLISALFVGLVSFCIASFFNDSTVLIGSLQWSILGLLASILKQ